MIEKNEINDLQLENTFCEAFPDTVKTEAYKQITQWLILRHTLSIRLSNSCVLIQSALISSRPTFPSQGREVGHIINALTNRIFHIWHCYLPPCRKDTCNYFNFSVTI
jgi:hypothetical protein